MKKIMMIVLEIVLLISFNFAISYNLDKIFGIGSKNNLVSAFEMPNLFEEGNSICIESQGGKKCQTTTDSDCAASCLPGKCVHISTTLGGGISGIPDECKLGTCQDPEEGICSFNAPQGECENQGGNWFDDPNGNVAECKKGCCITGTRTEFTTELQCKSISESLGFSFGTDAAYFDSTLNTETSCLLSAVGDAEGACVLGESAEEPGKQDCKRLSKTECDSKNGVFYEGLLCSNEELNTVCDPKNNTSCADGFDEVYWFDGCGNRENIFGSDYQEGKIISKQESCKIGSSGDWLKNQEDCGNCNRLTSSICGKETGDQELNDEPDSGFICKDLGCYDSGQRRENGETWCNYQTDFGVFPVDIPWLGTVSWLSGGGFGGGFIGGRAIAPAGSQYFRKACVDGEIQTQSCSAYRNEICEESRGEGNENSGQFSTATCRTNRWQECINYNPPDKGEGLAGTAKVVQAMAKCELDPDCFVKTVDVGKDFKFPTCLPKYPPGFDLGVGEQNGQEVCGFASQSCSAIFIKKASAMGFGGTYWECMANCDCVEGDNPDSANPSTKFITEMSDFCSSLGDCGAKVNYQGTVGSPGSLAFKKCVMAVDADSMDKECKNDKPVPTSTMLAALALPVMQMTDIEPKSGKYIKSDPVALEKSIGASNNEGIFGLFNSFLESGGQGGLSQGISEVTGLAGGTPNVGGYQARELPWVGGIMGASGIGLSMMASKGMIPGLATKAAGTAVPATSSGLSGKAAMDAFGAGLGQGSASTTAPEIAQGVAYTGTPGVVITSLPSSGAISYVPVIPSQLGVDVPMIDVLTPSLQTVEVPGAYDLGEGVLSFTPPPVGTPYNFVPVIQDPFGNIVAANNLQVAQVYAPETATYVPFEESSGAITPAANAQMFSPTSAAFGGAMIGSAIGGAVASILIAVSGIGPGIGPGGTYGLMGGGMVGGGLAGAGIAGSGGATIAAGTPLAAGSSFVGGAGGTVITSGTITTSAGTVTATAAAPVVVAEGATATVAGTAPATLATPAATAPIAGASTLLVVGIVVLVVVITMIILNWAQGVGDMKKVEVSSECKPWTPPLGGANCEKCGEDGFPCNAYACSSLGTSCALIGNEPNTVCIDSNPHDVSGPIISPIEANVSGGYRITDDSDTGFTIEKDSGEKCLEEFDRTNFAIQTSEYSQCKIGLNPEESFEDMTQYFGDSNIFSKEHSHEVSSQWIIDYFAQIGNPFEDEESRNVLLYIKCQDALGNPSGEFYAASVCITKKDSTPPLLTSLVPTNLILPFNATKWEVRVLSNEPAEVRWDFEDKNFDDMENHFVCPNAESIVACFGTVPIKDDEVTIYVRGKDHPEWKGNTREDERHSNEQSIVITLRKSDSALKIDSLTPDDETITIGTPTASVEIQAETSGGVDGTAICELSIDREKEFTFKETGGKTHKQLIERFRDGKHDVFVKCVDLAGNEATASSSFTIVKDLSLPKITRAYKDGGNLVVITQEPADCAFVTRAIGSSTKTCGFSFDEGTAMTKSDNDFKHATSLDNSLEYLIKCKDSFGNADGKCGIIVAESYL